MMMLKKKKRISHAISIITFLSILAVLLILPKAGWATGSGSYTKPEQLVDEATIVIKHVLSDPHMGWARCHLQQAEAIIIFPSVIKGAFLVGGEGGSGVALARDKKTGEWSYPAFYTMGSVSFGLQIGGKVSEVLLMVMTQKGLDALLTTSFKLGGDVGIAAGPVGTGVQGKLTDILSFVNSKGAFAGISLDGAVIAPRNSWNSSYYGKPVVPSDIFIRKTVSNPQADKLRIQVSRIKK